jgi:hypothetical protein
MPDAMNVAAPLHQVFKQLRTAEIMKSMKALKPIDKVSVLSVTMNFGGLDNRPIRHIPIIEPSPEGKATRGTLKALISKTDLSAILTPPIGKIPPQRLHQVSVSELGDTIKRVSGMSILDAFPDHFEGETPQLFSDAELKEAFKLLTTYQVVGNRTRRYRTIPIFDDKHSLIGMLSYYNVLAEIKNRGDHLEFREQTVRDLIAQIGQKELVTTRENDLLFDAVNIFNGSPFTHLPITSAMPGRTGTVTRMIDDATTKSFQHGFLIKAFSECTLSEIADPIQKKHTVTLENKIEDVLNKLLSGDRPTAILVGNWGDDGFFMEGLISYIDVLRAFAKILPGFADPVPVAD